MIVTGALCWWNELPEDLDRCVRGLALVADRVVALDGAYVRYPTATIRSNQDQLDAIRDACRDTGLECLIIQPDRLWAGQVEKRSHLLAAATVGSDWIITIDADHVIKTNRREARAFLETIRPDVLTVPYITPPNPDRPMEYSAVGQWHIDQMGEPQMIPHIWRAMPGLRVERFHWWYSAVVNGQRHWVWGGDGTYPDISSYPMQVVYTVEHRTMMRTKEQVRLSRAFLNDREWVVSMTGQEDDRADLERPVWNYERIPA